MLSVSCEIVIAAPRAKVWRVIEDVLDWPQWTPTVTNVRQVRVSRLEKGSRYAIKQPLQREADWEVIDLERERRFTWERRGSFIRLCATHERSEDLGETVNRLTIEADGLAVTLLRPLLSAAFSHALATENAALKRLCETRFQTLQEEGRCADSNDVHGMTKTNESGLLHLAVRTYQGTGSPKSKAFPDPHCAQHTGSSGDRTCRLPSS